MGTFKPPTQRVRRHRLFTIYQGVTVINNGGVFAEKQYPSQSELDAATAYYVGGHEYTVTGSEEAALVAAGYAVT